VLKGTNKNKTKKREVFIMTKQEILNRLAKAAQTKGEHIKKFEYEEFCGSIIIRIGYKAPQTQATIDKSFVITLGIDDRAVVIHEYLTINCWCEEWISSYRKNWDRFLMANRIEYSVAFEDVLPYENVALFTVKTGNSHTVTYEYDYYNNILDRITSEKVYTIED
jgi:hypothetical protein